MSLLLASLVIGGLLVGITVIALLTFKKLLDWYRNKNKIKDKHHVNVMLKQYLDNGNYRTITGVFDPYSDKIHDAKAFESKSIDAELAAKKECCVIHEA